MFDSFYNNFIAEDRYRMILDGLQVTLLITAGAVVLGTILGGLICWMRMSRHKWLQKVAKVYIDIMRGTPVLVVLMLMYYVIMAPLEATGIVVAIVTFGMNTAAYIGEMLRTSIQGIERGQTEAGLALGYTPRQTFIRIVLPQVVKSVMPVYEGEVVSLLKGTSIVGYIAVADMPRASDLIRSRTFNAFLPIILTAVIYFFMAWLIGRLLKSLVEKRHLKALTAAAGLLIGATLCYIPELFSSPGKADEVADSPAIFQALAGKDVGVVIGSIQDIAVTEMAPDANIQRMATIADLIAALEAGKVDIAGSESLTLVFNKDLAARLDSVSAGMPAIPVGACFRMDETELQQDFNDFLSEIRRDGTYQKILARWTQADDPSTLAIPHPREHPVHSATKAFIQRIRKEVFEIDGPDFDFLGMHSSINAFCYKYGIMEKQLAVRQLTEKMINDIMAAYRPMTVRITHSEQSGVTALDFMVEKMETTPLSEHQRSQLAGQCRQVVEEPTERGFRVKLIV